MAIALLTGLSVLLFAALSYLPAAGAEEKPTYVGDNAKKCKVCHPTQVKAWQKLDMAKAVESLKGDALKDEKCLKCHVTGWGEKSGFKSMKETPKLANVQCEACHGAASLHLKVPITDKEKKRATVEMPTKETCQTCHNKEYPDFKGFDFAKFKPKIKHWKDKE